MNHNDVIRNILRKILPRGHFVFCNFCVGILFLYAFGLTEQIKDDVGLF